MGKSLYFAVIIVNPKLLREKGTEARFPISLPCTRLLLLLPVYPFHLVVDGFVYLEISSVLLQNKLKLTDSQTEVFCLNSRLYSGTSFFYRITVSSFSKKKNKKKNYTFDTSAHYEKYNKIKISLPYPTYIFDFF